MKHLLFGVAFAALTVCPLHAQGKGHGQGNGGGQGNDGHGPSMHGPSMHGPSMQGPSMPGPSMRGPSMAPAMPGPAMQPAHGKGRGHGGMKPAAPGHAAARDVAHRNNGKGGPNIVHAARPVAPKSPHGNAMGPAIAGERVPGKSPDGVRQLKDGRHYYTARGTREAFGFSSVKRGLIDGCPPGLATKNNGCQPPGQARQNLYRPDWWGARTLSSGPYLYDDGYLLRMDGERVAGYLPLLGGALSVGNIWPRTYAPLPVPQYYVDYYDLGPVGSYRYADDVLYRVDPSTSAITAIAALLTGDTFQIGSPMPAGYDVYNVPRDYRNEYADGPGARYRYSDGYIYQVDPKTQLITAAIDLLAGR